jgi:hypothetical protein
MLNIAKDGQSISWEEAGFGQRWTAYPPSLSEWQQLWQGNQRAEALAKGVFMWINGEGPKEVMIVFSSYKGLDFNLTYSIESGKLLKIEEAR